MTIALTMSKAEHSFNIDHFSGSPRICARIQNNFSGKTSPCIQPAKQMTISLIKPSAVLRFFVTAFWWLLFMAPLTIVGQSDLVANGNWHKLHYSGNYVDLKIPENTTFTHVEFSVAGGNGGKVYNLTECSTIEGGRGALVKGVFTLGNSVGNIPKGRVLRFVVGGKGEDNSGAGGGGGGGGSGIMDVANNRILVVAGGGGGSSAHSSIFGCYDYAGKNASLTTSGTSGGSGGNHTFAGGTNGNGGECTGATPYGGGGGGAFGHALGLNGVNYDIGGDEGTWGGGAGGTAQSGSYTVRKGGWGFGGGGAGFSNSSISGYSLNGAGGGGGGYSGGGAGNYGDRRGGGGGSYVETDSYSEFFQIKDGNDTENGYVSYRFLNANDCNPTITSLSVYNPPNCSGEPSVTFNLGGNAGCSNLYYTINDSNGYYSQFNYTGTFSGMPAGNYTAELRQEIWTPQNGTQFIVHDQKPFTITSVNDQEFPTAVCKNVTVRLNSAGVGTLYATDVDNGSYDDCGITQIGFPEPGTTFNLLPSLTFTCDDLGQGPLNRTFMVKDAANRFAYCLFEVTLEDTSGPKPINPDFDGNLDLVIPIGPSGTFTLTEDYLGLSQLFEDNCTSPENFEVVWYGGNDNDTYTCDDVSSTPFSIIAYVRDEDNLASSGITFTTYVVDTSMADVTYNQNITLNLGSNGEAALTQNDVLISATDDNCLTESEIFNSYDFSNMVFNCSQVGVNNVNLISSNASVPTLALTVTIPNTLPTVTANDVSMALDDNGVYQLIIDDVDFVIAAHPCISDSDVRGVYSIPNDALNYDCSDIGDHVINLNKSDASYPDVSFTLSIADETPPVITCPEDITFIVENGSETATFNLTATDACSSATIVQTEGIASGGDFPIGITTNTFKATDAHGNESFCSFDVTALDKMPPTANCNDVSFSLDTDTGTHVVQISDIDNGSIDNSGQVSLSLSAFVFEGETSNTTEPDALFGDQEMFFFNLYEFVAPISATYEFKFTADVSASGDRAVMVLWDAEPVANSGPIFNREEFVGYTMRNDNGSLFDGTSDFYLEGGKTYYFYMTTSSGGLTTSYKGSVGVVGDQLTFNCDSIGTNSIQLLVEDPYGNRASCTAQITITNPFENIASCIDGVLNTYVPDDNFEQALIDLGHDVGPLDDQVPTINIASLSTLDIASKGIADLTGIEGFISLTSLNVSNNVLSTADFSNNTLLHTLDISGNAFNSMDDSTLNQLAELYASGCSFTELDFSNNTVLTHLDLSNNNLNRLYIKNGTNTQLQLFKTINNPALECIEVQDVTFMESNFSNFIDGHSRFSNNCFYDYTYVPDNAFEQALIDLGLDDFRNDYVLTSNIIGLTSLEVSSRNIKDLTGIEAFVSLTTLDVSDNLLTTIDISNNIDLDVLNVSNNTLNALDVTYLIKLGTLNASDNSLALLDVSNCVSLLQLDVSSNSLTALDISKNTALTQLNVSGNSLTSLDIANNNALEQLNVSNNSFTSLNVSNNTALLQLDVSNNTLSTLGLSSLTNLTALNMASNSFTNIDVSNNSLLQVLDISGNAISMLDVSSLTNLAEFYAANNAFAALDLSSNGVLTNVLISGNSNLITLNLKNGNNTNITSFTAEDVPHLFCIEADDPTYMQANFPAPSPDERYVFLSDCNYGETTYVPDDNFEQALIDLGYDYGPLDDYVPTSNIFLLRNLTISSKSISDLTGIEDFAALEDLTASSNDLQTVNLSYNTKIRKLSFQGNNLETLDLSSNSNLHTIFLGANPDLRTLNLKNGNNGNIQAVFLQLLPELQCVEVDDPNHFYSNINLDVVDDHITFSSDCQYDSTYIPDDNFEQALIDLGYDNILDDYVLRSVTTTITTLDLSAKNIIDLTGLQEFTALEALNVSYNNVTAINLTNILPLREVILNDTSIQTVNLANNINLETVNVSNNEYIDELNVKNGNNANFISFDALNVPYLECIEVSDPVHMQNNFMNRVDDHIMFTTNCRYNMTYVPDDNFESWLISSGYDDEAGIMDNYLWKWEAAGGVNMTPINRNISDFTGLQDFINIRRFDVRGNAMASLDLRDNTKIETVDISNNPNLTTFRLKNGNNTNITSFTALNVPNLYCIEVDDPAYMTANFSDSVDPHIVFTSDCSSFITLNLKVYLQGAFLGTNTGSQMLMRDDLRAAQSLPVVSPYADALTVDTSVFDLTGPNAIVDWVWLELRDATDNTLMVAGQSALVQRDGDVVNLAGKSTLVFDMPPDSYYVAIKHRNHLGVMSASPMPLTNVTTELDFTSNSMATYGNHARTTFGMPDGTLGMWAGDANGDGKIIFLNTGAEAIIIKNVILAESAEGSVFGASIFYVADGYFNQDLNMDHKVIFTNGGNELQYIKDIILSHPDNQLLNSVFFVISAQLP